MEAAIDRPAAVRPVTWGLMLPSRGIVLRWYGPERLFQLTDLCETSDLFDSVWAGDSIMAKPRLESITLLSALAARTRRVRLGPAALASFPLREPILLALQWASLDVLSGGRTILAVAIGGSATSGGDFAHEFETFGIDPRSRATRLEEGVQALRRLWSDGPADFEGRYVRFRGVDLQPKPVQRPGPPIWLVSQPFQSPNPAIHERAFRRVATLAEGWMTTRISPDEFARGLAMIRRFAAEAGRDPDAIDPCICYNLNINDDAGAAFAEAKRFMDAYYMADYSREYLANWVGWGPPAECARLTQQFIDAGARTFVLRFPGLDWPAQMRRFAEEVVPRLRLP